MLSYMDDYDTSSPLQPCAFNGIITDPWINACRMVKLVATGRRYGHRCDPCIWGDKPRCVVVAGYDQAGSES